MNVRLLRLNAGLILNLKHGATYRVESDVPPGAVVTSAAGGRDGNLTVLVACKGCNGMPGRPLQELTVKLVEVEEEKVGGQGPA